MHTMCIHPFIPAYPCTLTGGWTNPSWHRARAWLTILSQGGLREMNNRQTLTFTPMGDLELPMNHVFGPWKKAREPGENPQGNENMQTSPRNRPNLGIEPSTFLLRGNISNHSTTVLPPCTCGYHNHFCGIEHVYLLKNPVVFPREKPIQ